MLRSHDPRSTNFWMKMREDLSEGSKGGFRRLATPKQEKYELLVFCC